MKKKKKKPFLTFLLPIISHLTIIFPPTFLFTLLTLLLPPPQHYSFSNHSSPIFYSSSPRLLSNKFPCTPLSHSFSVLLQKKKCYSLSFFQIYYYLKLFFLSLQWIFDFQFFFWVATLLLVELFECFWKHNLGLIHFDVFIYLFYRKHFDVLISHYNSSLFYDFGLILLLINI